MIIFLESMQSELHMPRSRLNLFSKQRSNYSNQIPLISLKLGVSIKAEEELKKKKNSIYLGETKFCGMQ